MALKVWEDKVAVWFIRVLRFVNILVISGSVAFLTFEFQFEPHPAEFGWSLIMISITTLLSGAIGFASAGHRSCFFPHMFLIFVSLSGLVSLSILLFVRPDEVARKMLTLHISFSCAMRHTLINAYFFCFLGFLQIMVLALALMVYRYLKEDYHCNSSSSFEQVQLNQETATSSFLKDNLNKGSSASKLLSDVDCEAGQTGKPWQQVESDKLLTFSSRQAKSVTFEVGTNPISEKKNFRPIVACAAEHGWILAVTSCHEISTSTTKVPASCLARGLLAASLDLTKIPSPPSPAEPHQGKFHEFFASPSAVVSVARLQLLALMFGAVIHLVLARFKAAAVGRNALAAAVCVV